MFPIDVHPQITMTLDPAAQCLLWTVSVVLIVRMIREYRNGQ